jgi:mannose-1-phosphate guanylyltransferase
MHAIIMAGGSGTRFWPMSRKRRPKQLLPIFGDRSMLACTVERIAPLARAEDMVVVTAGHLVGAVGLELPGLPEGNILAEPVGRNTAPCIGLAAHLILKRARLLDPNADPLIGVFPSDHHIGDNDAFLHAIEIALEAAAEPGTIVTLGIRPNRPETGYGYIRFLPSVGSALDVERFVEKPDLDTARAYLATGSYLWNAGLFFFRASTILGEIERQLPEMAAGLALIAADLDTPQQDATLARVFPTLQNISIDYGVMEGARRVKVVATNPKWSDVGHWAALPELMTRDAQGNATRGEALTVDTQNALVLNETPGHVVALVGVKDLVVVHTPDATLVLPRERAQDVRSVIDALQASGHGDKL